MTESEVVPVVNRKRTTPTWLTGAVGILIVAAAFVMMACAAPSLASPRPHAAVTHSAPVPARLLSAAGHVSNRGG